MQDSEWRRWLHELMKGDVGPSHNIIDAASGPMIGWATYDMLVVRRWHNNQMHEVLVNAPIAMGRGNRDRRR
jgi:hypothetical protein